MMSKKVLRPILVIVPFCLAAAFAIGAITSDSDDEAAIKTLIGKLNMAWRSENGAEIMRGVISDKSFAFAISNPRKPSEAIVLNKAGFCNAMANMLKNNRPTKHVHQTKSISVFGPLAYEIGVTEETSANGASTSQNVLLLLAKEEEGWKIISWAPADDVAKALDQFKAKQHSQ